MSFMTFSRAAGVFLIARSSFVYEQTNYVLDFVAVLGASSARFDLSFFSCILAKCWSDSGIKN